ncbi:hypothetical protein NQ317_017179 [Molorchus minor]|uniref:Uncharacterized protein n=1 Tax=Molorchus minor TaxID=1323400 RepID=A0ABQ9J0J4_9CUCU|nr:hypothetical protein NQ317_017179 [Molorchus minor]
MQGRLVLDMPKNLDGVSKINDANFRQSLSNILYLLLKEFFLLPCGGSFAATWGGYVNRLAVWGNIAVMKDNIETIQTIGLRFLYFPLSIYSHFKKKSGKENPAESNRTSAVSIAAAVPELNNLKRLIAAAEILETRDAFVFGVS